MSTERWIVRKVKVTGDGGCHIVAFTDGKDWWVKDSISPFVSYLARPTGLRCGEFYIYSCVFPRSSVRWNKKIDRVYLKKVQFGEIRRMYNWQTNEYI